MLNGTCAECGPLPTLDLQIILVYVLTLPYCLRNVMYETDLEELLRLGTTPLNACVAVLLTSLPPADSSSSDRLSAVALPAVAPATIGSATPPSMSTATQTVCDRSITKALTIPCNMQRYMYC